MLVRSQHTASAASSQAVRTFGGCPFSPSYTPQFPTGLATAASPWQTGHNVGGKQAGKEVHQTEGLLQMGGPQSHGGWELGLDGVFMWTSKTLPYHQLRDSEGLLSCPVLCILMTQA